MVRQSAFLFIGEDGYLKDKAMEDLAASILDGSSKQLDYKVFYGSQADTKDVLDYITTIPFLAPKRVAVIKEFEKLPKEDVSRIVAYLKKPSKSACLILDSKDDSILKEHDTIMHYVNVQRFGAISDYEVFSWIRQFLSNKNKSIKEDALRELKELQGSNLSMLGHELEKLVSFIGDKEVRELKDVEELVGKTLTLSAFDLTAAIEKSRPDEAIDIISGLLLAGKKHYEIIGLLCWHFNRLFKAKTLQSKSEKNPQIADILRINRRYSVNFFKQLEGFSADQLRSKLHILLEADLDIKRTRLDPALVLEFAVIRLCLS